MTRAKKTPSKTDVLLDELLEGCASPEDIFGKHGLVKQLTKRLVERVGLPRDLEAHLRDVMWYVRCGLSSEDGRAIPEERKPEFRAS